MATGFFLVL